MRPVSLTSIHSTPEPSEGQRVALAGKFFCDAEGHPFFIRGVSYGPFKANQRGEPFPEDAQLKDDIRHMAALGFNTVRIYEAPTALLLKEAEALQLKLLVGIPWMEHVDFTADRKLRHDIRQRVVEMARCLKNQPTVAALLVGNEIEKTLVRWMGPERVRNFLEHLIDAAKREAPKTLVSYATYPSTEYLIPRNADFLAVNVYLESAKAFTRCIDRLQNLAGNKPLLISEFGLDAKAHGETIQAEAFAWEQRCLLGGGCAGGVWFAYTDEWHRGGHEVTDWHFGLVDSTRRERAASHAALTAPRSFEVSDQPPHVSVIVCTRNGAATLKACLESLEALKYPNYEVLVIDDGSTDTTAEIAQSFSCVTYVWQEHAGLSAARNLGALRASGTVLVYTDDDCIAPREWLLHLTRAFEDLSVVAAGGPNIPPRPRNHVERVVATAPGAPAHVLLTDTEAEHLPGCNLAVRKDVLERIGGFQPQFRTAGDDVDVCWRLQQVGKLRFVPGAMVWHHRRFSVRAYLRQQQGYGYAEALLMKAHPQRFGLLGGARWRGGIYGDHLPSDHPVEGSIFHGAFGLGAFQTIYASSTYQWWECLTGVLWPALLILALVCQQIGVAGAVLLFSVWAAWRISQHHAGTLYLTDWKERVLLVALCWLQPLVREWARLQGMVQLGARPSWAPLLPEIVPPEMPHKRSLRLGTLKFWSETGITRDAWLATLQQVLKNTHVIYRQDDGWRWFDIESWPNAEVSRAFLSVTEYHGNGRCLTRVRLLLRVRRGLEWNVLLWLVLASILMATGMHTLLLLGLAAVGSVLALVPLGMWLIRREMLKQARQAAQNAGLVEMR